MNLRLWPRELDASVKECDRTCENMSARLFACGRNRGRMCVCVCVVKEVNVFLLAHSGGSSWSKGRGGLLLVLTLVPMYYSEHAGLRCTTGPNKQGTVYVCVCV